MNSENKKLLESLIRLALNKVYEYDNYLIENPQLENRSNHASERGIVFRFGIYLQNLIKENKIFDEYNIDMEYNRNFIKPKILPSFPNGTYPDLILHKRGNNEYNLLVIEFKTWWNKDNKNDIEKIKEFMDINGEYKYKFGLSIIINKNKPDLNWI